MSEYIKRQWLLTHTHTGMDIIEMMQTIMDAPTEDAEPVVRCRECSHYGLYVREPGEREYCDLNRRSVSADGYCDLAQRRGGA